MTLNWKDALATILTAFAVFVFAAAHGSWNVWLVGSSNRWAAGAILLVGIAACSLGKAGADMGKDTATKTLAAIGTFSLLFAVWALVTGSVTALALLTLSVVVLWGGSTLRHAWHGGHAPLTT